jgi:nitrite reductase (NADH) large subunit
MKKEQFVVIANGTDGVRFVEVKDVGVVAMEAGRWKIYVENVAESGLRSDLLCTVSSRQEVVKYIGRFIQFYRENRRYVERTYDFVKRITIEKVRRILVEDSNGICSRLDGEIQGAVQPFRDPVQISTEVIHMPQFVELLEPVGAGVGPFERKRHSA